MKRNNLLKLAAIALLGVVLITVQGCWLFEPDIPASTITRISAGSTLPDVISQEIIFHDDGTATKIVTSVSDETGEEVVNEYELDKTQLKDLFILINSKDILDDAMKPMESDEDLDEACLPIVVECGDDTYVPPSLVNTNYHDRTEISDMLVLLDRLGTEEAS